MTHAIQTSSTGQLLDTLADLVAARRDFDKQERIAEIIARRESITVATVYAMAAAELAA